MVSKYTYSIQCMLYVMCHVVMSNVEVISELGLFLHTILDLFH